MKLEQLEIENFKCFKTKKTFDFGRITVLTGANSSGKSTVMQAILGAIQTDGFPFYYSPNGKYVNLGDFKEMVNYLNIHNPISVNIKVKEDENIIKTLWTEDNINFLPQLYMLELDSNDIFIKCTIIEKSILLFIFQFKEKIDFDYIEKYLKKYLENDDIRLNYKWKITQNVLELFLNIEDISDFVFTHLPWFDTSQEANLYSKYILSPITKINNYLYDILDREENFNFIGPSRNTPIRTYLEKNKLDFKIGVEGEGYIDQIVDWEKRSNGKIEKLVEVLKDLDLLEEIKVNRLSGGRFELLVRSKNSKILTSLTNVGFGVSQFLPIIVADLQLSNNSTLFLAEPEIHLHPSIQAKFADYLIKKITTTEKNYVIETHSEYFLNRLRLAIVKGELKKEDFKIYFLENNGDDTTVSDIDFTKTGAIKNAPRNFFETYAIDVMDIAMNSFAE